VNTNRRLFLAGLSALAPLSSLPVEASANALDATPDYFTDLGMMVAVERSMAFDEQAEYQRQREIVNAMGSEPSPILNIRSACVK